MSRAAAGYLSKSDAEAALRRFLAATTINQSRAIVRGVFAAAVKAGLGSDPSAAFSRAKTRRATSDAITFYKPDEVQRLVAHAGNEQDATLYLPPSGAPVSVP